MNIKFLDDMGNWIMNRKSRKVRFVLFILLFFCIAFLFLGILSFLVWALIQNPIISLIVLAGSFILCLAISFAWELSE